MDAEITITFSKDEFEILEEFDFDEPTYRSEELRYYPLNEQLDDYVQAILDSGDGASANPPARLLRSAGYQRRLLEDMYLATTERGPEGVPHPKEALHPVPAFTQIVPYVRGVEVLRDLPDATAPEGAVIVAGHGGSGSGGSGAKTPTQNPLERLRVLDLVGNALDPLTAGTAAQEVFYDGFVPKPPSFPPTRKRTKLLPGEQRVIRGWLVGVDPARADILALLNDDGAYVTAEDNPELTAVAAYFHEKPVLFREYRKLPAPTLDDVVQHAPSGPHQPQDAAIIDYLKRFSLAPRDLPYHAWTSLFPNASGTDVDPAAARADIIVPEQPPLPAAMPSIYGPMPAGMAVSSWVLSHVDRGQWIYIGHLLGKLPRLGTAAFTLPLALPDPKPPTGTPPTTLAECTSVPARSYAEFISQGIFRSETRECIPVDVAVRQQLARRVRPLSISDYEFFLQKKLRELTIALTWSQQKSVGPKSEAAADTATVEAPTTLQLAIRHLLEDAELSVMERVSRVRGLLVKADVHAVDNQYLDASGNFLVCEHELAGDTALTATPEYDIVLDGKHVCKYCGGSLGYDELVSSDEYTDDGFRIITHGDMDAAAPGGSQQKEGDGAPSPNEYLLEILQPDAHPEGGMLAMLLIMLGMYPDAGQLRQLAAAMFSSAAEMTARVPAASKQEILRMIGMAWFVILVKVHRNPFLSPSRPFPRFSFSRSGFPRDPADKDFHTSPLIDWVLKVVAFSYKSNAHLRLTHRDPLLAKLVDKPAEFRSMLIGAIRSVLPRAAGSWPQDAPLDAPSASAAPGEVQKVAMKNKSSNREFLLPLDYIAIPVQTAKRKGGVGRMLAQTHAKILAQATSSASTIPGDSFLLNVQAREETAHKQFRDLPDVRSRAAVRLDARTDLDATSRMQYELQCTVAVTRDLVRTFAARAAYRYTPKTIEGSESDPFLRALRQKEAAVSSIPGGASLDADRLAKLTELTDLGPALPGSWHVGFRLDVATWCLRRAVDLLEAADFGKTRVKEILDRAIEWETLAVRYTPGDVRAKIMALRDKERQAFRIELGKQDDASRKMFVDMMNLGLISSSLIVDQEVRRAFALEVEQSEQSERGEPSDEPRDPTAGDMLLPVSLETDYDGPVNEEVYDRGDYGDLANGADIDD